MSETLAVKVMGLSKTFYTGFFAPIPLVRNYSFGRLHKVVSAVSNLDFEIHQGEVFALLGGNGAGKSTTMKMLMGLITPSAGEAFFFDEGVALSTARKSVGYLPENPSFYEELTPRELLKLFCALHGVNARQTTRHSDELLNRVGMSHAADRPLRKLSKGMHQRVGIAQALIGQPRLIVLDEPFSGLDPIGRREIRELLLEERARGATLLFSSHILPDVEALCDRFLILEHGQKRHEGKLSDLSSTSANQVELSLVAPHEKLIKQLLHFTGSEKLGGARKATGLVTFRLPESVAEEALRLCIAEQAQIDHYQRLKPQLESLFIKHEAANEPKSDG